MRDYLEQVGMPISLDDYLDRIQYKFDCAQIITLDQVPIGLFKAEFQAQQNLWNLIQIQIHPGYQKREHWQSLTEKNLIESAQVTQSRVSLSVVKKPIPLISYTNA
ncbi:N-acetyltransferase [Vibrio sinaloensis]|nr:N-acetyltransferase [Vibrio sinaloensis]